MPKKKPRQRQAPKQPRGIPPKRRATTRSQTKPARDRALAIEQQRLRDEANALARRRAQDLRNRPVAAPGNRGDGNLYIAHVKVGQGDCTIMATPGGQILLFDCGSDAKDGENDAAFARRIKAVLTGPKFMRGYDTVDVLILTHPDTDHYNLLGSILNDTVTIENAYFSSQMRFFAQGQTSTFVRDHIRHHTRVKKVVHNHDPGHGAAGAVSLDGTPVAAAGGGVTVDRLDGSGGILIVDEPTCKVSILAADVSHQYVQDNSDQEGRNRGSVVTLITKGANKVLMCGDATFNTERYLLNTAAARIANATIAQAGHHASKLTSSSQVFIDVVNPQKVFASAPKNVPLHHLPSKEVINRYRTRLAASNRPAIPEHETFFWAAGGMGGYYVDSVFHTEQVYTTGSWDTIEFTL